MIDIIKQYFEVGNNISVYLKSDNSMITGLIVKFDSHNIILEKSKGGITIINENDILRFEGTNEDALKNKKGSDINNNIINGYPVSFYKNISKYQSVSFFNNDSYLVTNEYGLKGLIDLDGNEIIPCDFYLFEELEKGYIKVAKETDYKNVSYNNPNKTVRYYEKMGLYDVNGNNIIPCEYNNIEFISETIIKVASGIRWTYDPSILIDEDLYYDKYGLYDNKGNIITNCKYASINNIVEECMIVSLYHRPYGDMGEFNVKCGVINIKGEEIIPCIYNNIREIKDGVAVVVLENKFGYINTKGVKIFDVKFDFATKYSEGLFGVVKDGKAGFINAIGNILIPFNFKRVESFSETIEKQALVYINGKCGFIDLRGKTTIPIKYDFFTKINNDLIVSHIRKEERFSFYYGWYNVKGEEILPCEYDYISNLSFSTDDLILIKKEKKYGLLNIKGDELLPCEYDEISEFEYYGGAPIKKNNKYGCIIESTKSIIPCYYEKKLIFKNRVAIAVKNGMHGIVTDEGRELIPCIYESIEDFSNGYYIVKKEGKYGAVDPRNRLVIPFKYDSINTLCNGLLAVKDSETQQFQVISNFGNVVLPFRVEKVYANGIMVKREFVNLTRNYYLYNTKGEKLNNDPYIDVSQFTYHKYYMENRKITFKEEDSSINDYNNPVTKNYIIVATTKGIGLMNRLGNIIIPTNYESIEFLGDDYFKVCKNGKYGIYDQKGSIILPVMYGFIGKFINQVAPFAYEYYYVEEYNEDYGTKYGFINLSGNVVKECEYEGIIQYVLNFIRIGEGQFWSYFDYQGNEIGLSN